MPYPESPFDLDFNTRIITNLTGDESNNQNNLKETLEWLCMTPKITSYRVNTLIIDKETVGKRIQDELDRVVGKGVVQAEYLKQLPELILITHMKQDTLSIEKYSNEVIVDVDCGAAVLRGAHIYAPGVLGMLSGTQMNDKVSIYVDLSKKCRKGRAKTYLDGVKAFIGNGVVRMARDKLFGENLSPTGIAIGVLSVISGCPSMGDDFLPCGWALLQNVPSVLCVRALEPQRNEFILDMCAAPGNKTTHIAGLMENLGVLVAIDKTAKKVEQLKKTCKIFGAHVSVFQADSCKIVNTKNQNILNSLEQGPPFPPGTFDKILLDAPCSVLGKRPQFCNTTSEKVLKSYVPLQRKLFTAAVSLLKPKGMLVYSTCTITLAENEGMVYWALKTFDNLELVKPKVFYGGSGWPGTGLSEDERLKVQRFGPNLKFDCVGFFIACFVKR